MWVTSERAFWRDSNTNTDSTEGEAAKRGGQTPLCHWGVECTPVHQHQTPLTPRVPGQCGCYIWPRDLLYVRAIYATQDAGMVSHSNVVSGKKKRKNRKKGHVLNTPKLFESTRHVCLLTFEVCPHLVVSLQLPSWCRRTQRTGLLFRFRKGGRRKRPKRKPLPPLSQPKEL